MYSTQTPPLESLSSVGNGGLFSSSFSSSSCFSLSSDEVLSASESPVLGLGLGVGLGFGVGRLPVSCPLVKEMSVIGHSVDSEPASKHMILSLYTSNH